MSTRVNPATTVRPADAEACPPSADTSAFSGQTLPLLAVSGLGKAYGATRVLHDVSFDVRAGEIHTLMGENGAGKSTLMKILAGVVMGDTGRIELEGRAISPKNPQMAMRLGISLIHQEPLSFGDLTVAENVFLSNGFPRRRLSGWGSARVPARGRGLGLIDWPEVYRRTEAQLHALGVKLDPRVAVHGLSIADQQMVELATALVVDGEDGRPSDGFGTRVLLMDEPTAALTPNEAEKLFEIVRGLRRRGVAIVFVSHRLPEVFEISDRITVLRDGLCIGTRMPAETTPDEIIQMMVGRPVESMYERSKCQPGRTMLEVRNMAVDGQFSDVSFTVRAGEIVGLAGLVGAGRTEVARAIFGITPPDKGEVLIDGESVVMSSPRVAMRHGVAYVPEDRAQHGLLRPMSIAANITLPTLRAVSNWGWIIGARERQKALYWQDKMQTRMAGPRQAVGELSGGNQQKVVLSKWLETDPGVLILDEPTRGVDVGAKAEIHHHIAELARRGKAVLMISSDLPEVLAMADRVLVMRTGRLVAELGQEQATAETVAAAAVGTAPANGVSSTVQATDTVASARLSQPAQRWRSGNSRVLAVAAAVIATFVICTTIEPRFATADNLRGLMLYLPLVVVVAMGQMMVMVSRNIDLSVGSMMGLVAIVVGNMFITFPTLPVGVAAAVAVFLGAVLGLVNGVLIAVLRVPSIIATLGTMTAYRGAVFIYSGGRQVDNNDLPAGLLSLAQPMSSSVWSLGISPLAVLAGVVAVVTAGWLAYTHTGRCVFALGSNPQAAELRGIATKKVLTLIFVMTGALSGLAGLMYTARYGYVNPGSTGAQFELVVISAVVIGGVAVQGGSGSVLGVVLGCLLLAMIGSALPMLGVSPFWQQAIYGLAILLAVSADSLVRRMTRKARVA
jgi:ABC-type sugar transport system ATPase subunit/ribose/xylose/arabinose/galactoside ABC-type transport system permease subunit